MSNENTKPPLQKYVVWDPVLRCFHWLLVATFCISWFSQGQDIRVHIISGTLMAGLLLFRLVWGLIGDRHALFSVFYPSITALRQHANELLHLKSRHYIGHTPIGSVMIFILLISLFILAGTGMALMGLQMGVGLFANALATAAFGTELWLQNIHLWCFTILQLLVAIHLAGVFVESLLQRRNLVMAMITGKSTKQITTKETH